VPNPYPVHHVRAFKIGEGFDLHQMKSELDDYTDILLGRVDPPFDHGVLTLMELAEAAHARAREMEMDLLDKESEGVILKDSLAYKFRTGKLRSFIELSKRTIDLGSRRVTYWREEGL
jgi:hypothetical protein